MIVDGKAIAEEVYAELERRGVRLGRTPRLGILVASSDPVIGSFVRIKTRAAERLGVEIVRENLSERADTAEVIAAVHALAPRVDGLIVQLPLPERIDVEQVLAAIPPEKDIDAINPTVDEHLTGAPVAEAVGKILEYAGVEIRGKSVLIVGHGRLVGKPVEWWFRKQGVRPFVVSDSENFKRNSKNADIVILGVGESGLVSPDQLKKGVVLIDAGTSEAGGKIRGDADPSCADVASVFTPVPGGVGPVAVAMIFKNLFDLAGAQ